MEDLRLRAFASGCHLAHHRVLGRVDDKVVRHDQVVGCCFESRSLVVRVLDLGEELAPVELNMNLTNLDFESIFFVTSASLLRIDKVSSISFAAMRLGTFEKDMKTNICTCH